MKKILIFTLCFLSTGMLFAQDLKLDEVIANYFKAVGQDKITKVQSMKMIGKMSNMGMEMTMTIIRKRPNFSRTEVDLQGTKIISAIDGETGWMIMPFGGNPEPQDMTEEQLKQSKREDLDGPFANWKEKGNQLDLLGKEDMEGTPVYNIKMTSKENEVSNFYVDASKFVILKVKASVTAQGQTADVETKFSDFRVTNGIQSAFKIETVANGQAAEVTFDSIEYDSPVDNSIFKKPAATAK